MNPHPLTLAYIEKVAQRPGMFMVDFNLQELYLQLHGYEAALHDLGALGGHDPFNASLNDYLVRNLEISGSTGWANALTREFGEGEPTFQRFLALVEAARAEK